MWAPDPRDPPETYFDGNSAAGLVRPATVLVPWTCKYGCPGILVLKGTQVPHHAWNCPYWENEGSNDTPF